MEIQLQELIDKIKKDGVESASEEAARIKHEAESEASQIVAAAKKEADEIVNKGKADVDRSEKAGKAALEQASRNLVLGFKAEIEALLDTIITKAASASYNEDTLKAVLPEILKAWTSSDSDSLSVDLFLSEANLEKLKNWASGCLGAELKKGLELKSDKNLGSGFKIAKKDGSLYYDFSAEAVAEMLSVYLNSHLADVLKTAVKGM